MKYIDIKVTIWNRLHLPEDTDMNEIIQQAENGNIDVVLAANIDDSEWEELLDTQQELHPIDNDGNSTIEIYNSGNVIWENGK